MVAPAARPGLCRNPTRRPLKRAPSLICLTTGEPAGIGPDLSLMLAARRAAAPLLIGDVAMLRARARRLRVDVALVEYPDGQSVRGAVRVLHVPLAAPVRPGLPDPANAAYVLRTLDIAAFEWNLQAMRRFFPVRKGQKIKATNGLPDGNF